MSEEAASIARKKSLFNVLLAIQNLNEHFEDESFFDSNGVLIISQDEQGYMFRHFTRLVQ
jgi:hypothetical protein